MNASYHFIESTASLLFFVGGGFALAALDVGEFAFEFEVGIVSFGVEVAAFDGPLNGASGFLVVLAVTEPALLEQGFDIAEGIREAFVVSGELDFAHSGCIDEESAGGKGYELAVSCGVAAATVVVTYFAGVHGFVAHERVD